MKCEACDHENVDGARFCASCGVELPTHHDPSQDPLVGQVVGGRFRVTGVLGEGGMGIVYVGEQKMGSTVRKVAIKTLHAHLSKDPSVLARFHRECGTVAKLEHPNTIQFYDFGSTDDGTLYIAMEFVAGRPISDVLEKEGPFAPERVIKIMRQACGALEEAHNQGVIHRDLKPDNLILTERAGETDFVKVLDFGIAGRTEGADAQKEQKLTQQGMVLGTPPYMSPEQFTGKALDVRSDVYSLGVVAYEMLTGHLPFEAETPWEWATKHMTAAPTPMDMVVASHSIPDSVRGAIMRALSKDREQRQSTVREFFDELSGGGRLTVEQAALVGVAKTAAMAAAPAMGGVVGPAPMAGPAPVVGQVPMAAPALAAPAPSAQRGKSGGGKGLLIGLGGAGVLLALAIVIVLIRSGKPSSDADPTLGAGMGTGTSGPVSIAAQTEDVGNAATANPVMGNGVTPPPVNNPTNAGGSTKPNSGGKGGAAGTGGAPGAGGTPGAGGAPGASGSSSSGGAAATATATSPSTGGGTCDQCLAAARAGNIVAAASAYNGCTDAAAKSRCGAYVKSRAAGAAKSQALQGNCPAAKGIISAAKGMGAGSPALDNALTGSSCK